MSTSSAERDGVIDPAVVERATEWMARLWSETATDKDQAACARWRAEHPHHELAWRRLQSFESKFDSVPAQVARHALQEPAAAAYLNRRRALQLLGLMATAGGLAYLARGSDAWQLASAGHRTDTGEIREITLPDGTKVMLASASAIDVQFDDEERLVVLRTGEILVTTAPDSASSYRPFRVRGRDGTVRALGTRFSLRQDADHSHVSVFEGAVEVRPTRAPDLVMRIDAGQGATFSGREVQAISPVSQNEAAWARGILVADNMPLEELVAELGRYRTGLLRCDAEVAGLRVNGVFSLRDTDRALHNLSLALPVEAVSRTKYWVTVRADARRWDAGKK